jgi:glucose-6-phosphate 1-dehydrogenase
MRITQKVGDTMTEQGGVLLFVFGATGDLARRKLYPALYRLARAGMLGERYAVIGVARRTRAPHEYVRDVVEAVCAHSGADGHAHRQDIEAFAHHFTYSSVDIHDEQSFEKLAQQADHIERAQGLSGNRLVHLALAPDLFSEAVRSIASLSSGRGWLRLVVEKPFGTDLASAQSLQRSIMQSFTEADVYRIDHYLGKHMVRVLRTALQRIACPPLWEARRIEVSLLESIGVEQRGAYYDESGALRDMVQNHALQLLATLVCDHDARSSRDAVCRVLEWLRPIDTVDAVRARVVRGQYGAGVVDGQAVVAYRDEPHVHPHSQTETYVALSCVIAAPLWADVPVFLRTGKRLRQKKSDITVQFAHKTVHIGLHPHAIVHDGVREEALEAELLFDPHALDAYARLIVEALKGDKTYFVHWDEVRAAWTWIDPIVACWKEDVQPIALYEAGGDGPPDAWQAPLRRTSDA